MTTGEAGGHLSKALVALTAQHNFRPLCLKTRIEQNFEILILRIDKTELRLQLLLDSLHLTLRRIFVGCSHWTLVTIFS